MNRILPFLVVFCILMNSGFSQSDGDIGAVGGFPSPDQPEEQIQAVEQAVQNGQDVSGTISNPIDVKIGNGITANIEGDVVVRERKLTADRVSFSGITLTDVQGLRSEPGGFTIDFAQTFQNDDLFITNGQGITRVGDIITVAHVDSFVRAGATTTNANELVIHPARFEVAQADSLFSGCVRATDVTNSTVIIFQDAVEITPEDGLIISVGIVRAASAAAHPGTA